MGASEWVAGWARIKPDEPAIVFEGTPRSWRELDVRASWIGDARPAWLRPGRRLTPHRPAHPPPRPARALHRTPQCSSATSVSARTAVSSSLIGTDSRGACARLASPGP
jgi:hypothetical protein